MAMIGDVAERAAQRLAMIEDELRQLANPTIVADLAAAGVEVDRFRVKMEELRAAILKDFPALQARQTLSPVAQVVQELALPVAPPQTTTPQPGATPAPTPAPGSPPAPPPAGPRPVATPGGFGQGQTPPPPSWATSPTGPAYPAFLPPPPAPVTQAPTAPQPTVPHPALNPGQVPAFAFIPPAAIPMGTPPNQNPPPQPLTPPPMNAPMGTFSTATTSFERSIKMFGSLVGRMIAVPRDAARRYEENQPSLGSRAMAAGAMGMGVAGAIGSLAGAADPFSTMPTLKASMKGVAIEIGTSFLPVIDEASLKLQQLERWLEGLDPTIKKNAATWIGYAAAVGGGIFVLVKLGAAAWAAAKGVVALGAAMLANPVGLTVGVLGAAAAYLVLKNNIGGVTDKLKEMAGLKGVPGGLGGIGAGGGNQKAENFISTDEFKTLPEQTKQKIAAAGNDKAAIQQILQENLAQAKVDLKTAQEQSLPGMTEAAKIDKKVSQMAPGAAAQIAEKFNQQNGAWSKFFMGGKEREEKVGELAKPYIADIVKSMKDSGITGAQEWHVRQPLEAMALKAITTGSTAGAKVFGTMTPQGYNQGLQAAGQNVGLAAQEAKVKAAEAALQKSGGTEQLKRSYEGPQPAILETGLQLADRIQLAGLQGGDKDAENRAKQVANLEKNGEILKRMELEMTRIGGLLAPRFR